MPRSCDRSDRVPGGVVKSDGCSAYRAPPGAGYLHEPRAESTPQAAGELPPWVHIVTLQLKALATRRLPWRQRRAHLQSYLDEFCYRLNRRDQRLDLFRRILNGCVLYTLPATYSQLIAA